MTIPQLKALVIGLGLLIVAGLAVVATAIAHRLSAAGAPREAIALQLPERAAIVETVLDGDRLALRLETDRGPRVVIVDLASGRLVSTVEIER